MAQVCLNEGPCLSMDPGECPEQGKAESKLECESRDLITAPFFVGADIHDIMAYSRDHKELLWVWQGWRDSVGRQIRSTFERYVQLSNEMAILNGECPPPNP